MPAFQIVAVILFIGALVFVHEMGHFLVAKYFDIKVTKFSLGFGPPLVAFEHGETTYQIALVPLGGFVRMVGEHPGEVLSSEDQRRSFTHAPVHRRALVSLAGPAANLIFPIFCFFAYNLLEPEVIPPVVHQIEPGEVGDRAGLEPGDRILAVDGDRAWSFHRLVQLIRSRPGERVTLEVQRGEEVLSLDATPKPVKGRDFFGEPEERGMISVSYFRDGSRVGIEDRERLPEGLDGLRGGDQIVRVGEREVRAFEELGPALAAVGGQTVEVEILRPAASAAGDLVLAEPLVKRTFEAQIPEGVRRPADLGLALGAAVVRAVVPGGAAEEAGFRPGDRLVSVDGQPILHFWKLSTEALSRDGETLKVRVRRDGRELDLSLTPRRQTCLNEVTKKPDVELDLGFGRGPPVTVETPCSRLERAWSSSWALTLLPDGEPAHLSIDEALIEAVLITSEVAKLLATQLFKMFVTFEVSTDDIGGPLQFMNIAAKAAEGGMLTYLKMLALISINLGIFNLLPVPILDGGHLLFCFVEAVKRRPLSVEAREKAAMVGLALLAMLLLLALRNDIRTLGIF